MRRALEHGKKRTLQQTIEHSLSSPSRTAWTRKRRNEASCARRRNTRTPRQQRVFPIEMAADISSRKDGLRIDYATAGDCFDGGRRRKRGVKHQSSTREFPARSNLVPFWNIDWGGSVKEIRSWKDSLDTIDIQISFTSLSSLVLYFIISLLLYSSYVSRTRQPFGI